MANKYLKSDAKRSFRKRISLLIASSILILAVIVFLLVMVFGEHDPQEAPIPETAAPTVAEETVSLPETTPIEETVPPTEAPTEPPKVIYEIAPDALKGETPDPDCFGTATDPAELQWLLDEASEILDGQTTLFTTDVELYAGSEITYYLDDTIFAISWQQVLDNFVYTFVEVKVAHASQFRRYLVDGEYDSKPLYPTYQMAPMVNAVVATSGDYYRGRKHGVIYYDGEVRRFTSPEVIDTCFVDCDGNLILQPRGTFTTEEEVTQFAAENNINFSLAFGPILVNDGVRCEPTSYGIGEVNDTFPRTALCQRDRLHYVVVVANGDGPYWNYPNIHDLADQIETMGFQKAYSLDGGNTGAIVMNDTIQNPIKASKMRAISDCLYFATALPDEE